jgi:hypothetical protein
MGEQMNDPESTALSILTSAVSGVPEVVRTSFLKAISDLLGGFVAIPAAKLKQYAQGIEDNTAARSIAAAALAKAAVDGAVKDPLVLQVAANIYLPTDVRKAENRLRVAQSAAEELARDSGGSKGEGASPPEDDWMNRFMRFAEDASSERLRDLFGRILAGQILRPGAFGPATLRTLSELDQTAANDFSHAWSRSVGDAVDYNSDWQRGEGFFRWKRLSEAGLMAPNDIAQYTPPYTPFLNSLYALWSPMSVGELALLVYFQKGSASKWNHIEFTRTGREIGSLISKPMYEENMRQAAMNLPKNGLIRIELLGVGQAPELLWQASK